MIDQEIQNRMDAYRGNPQALMQRYAQSQQLIDLLALQKLKSEKEAAARQMQMGAPGQMPTVAQQREQQVLDGDELMPLLPGLDEGHVQADFKLLRDHRSSSPNRC